MKSIYLFGILLDNSRKLSLFLNRLLFLLGSNLKNGSLIEVRFSLQTRRQKKSNSASYLKIDEAILKQLKRAQRKISEQWFYYGRARLCSIASIKLNYKFTKIHVK